MIRKYIYMLAVLLTLSVSAPGACAAAATAETDSLDRLAHRAWLSAQRPLGSDTIDFEKYAPLPAAAVPAEPLRIEVSELLPTHCSRPSIYALPYSLTGTSYDWRRLWINTGVLTGAFVGTLFVLELLPEDATSWNRASLQDVPLFKRWRNHVIKEGPEWDHDKFVFNYVLHPYAGAAYFMGARSVGFNFYQSLLYATIISNIGWEFGIEAFMERPSYQDLFITPLIGSAVGESFYKLKRYLVDNDYCLFGSSVVGNIVAFLIDPINEVVGIFDHNPARAVSRYKSLERRRRATVSLQPTMNSLTLTVTF